VIRAILGYIAAEETADSVFGIVSKGIDTLKGELDHKVTELLDPHYIGHPITFNHYLTDNVQKAQSDRQMRSVENTLKKVFGLDHIKERGPAHTVDPFKFLTSLEAGTVVTKLLFTRRSYTGSYSCEQFHLASYDEPQSSNPEASSNFQAPLQKSPLSVGRPPTCSPL
jgi:hypothetical protein